MEKKSFYDLTFDQLKEFLIDKVGIVEKQAKMRSQQMFNAIYKKNIKSFDELTTFSLDLREKIKDLISLEKSAKIIEVQKSKSDGTIKFLLELKKDKRQTETVLIPDKSKSKYTICLSVSVGCFLNCQFCATAQIPKKLVRNLSASEIMSQIMLCKEYLNDWKTSNKLVKTQVLMGSGDFALNAENVRTYIQNAKHKDSLDYGRTRITVSSVGLGNKIKDLSVIEWAARELDVYFAWSLHNPINKQRLEMMPNGNYSIDDLIPKFKKYYQITKLPIFIEYVALENNITKEHANALVSLMKKVPSKLNLIEYNPLDNRDFKPATQENIDIFSKIIQDNGFLALFRKSKGRDINASCGSLALKRVN